MLVMLSQFLFVTEWAVIISTGVVSTTSSTTVKHNHCTALSCEALLAPAFQHVQTQVINKTVLAAVVV